MKKKYIVEDLRNGARIEVESRRKAIDFCKYANEQNQENNYIWFEGYTVDISLMSAGLVLIVAGFIVLLIVLV